MRILIVIFIIFNLYSNCFAQDNIYIEEEDAVRRMMDIRKELNFREDRYVKAWSIQLLVTRDKYLANKSKAEFSKKFRDLKADWQYEQPYYRLNVGAFYTKLEATMALHQLIDEYPDAYIFKNSQAKTTDF
jgi:hypothetical protein